MNAKAKNPMQPVRKDKDGVVRFKANEIVRFLLDNNGKIDLNMIAAIPFSQDDRQQFAQLIGYSVSGYGDLSYVTDASYAKADALVQSLTKKKRRRAA